jgi:hypothetical protein
MRQSDLGTWVSLARAALWPLVVLGCVIALRRPLAGFLGSVTGRVSKLSVFAVTVELAQVPEARPAWTSRLGNNELDFRGLTEAGQLTDSYAHGLFVTLAQPEAFDFAVIDLGHGKSWLTTRLYIFTLLLRRLRGLRCLVFTRTTETAGRIFLGTAIPENVLEALAAAYPWLDAAVAEATWPNLPTKELKPPDPDRVGLKARIRPDQTTDAYLQDSLGPQDQYYAEQLTEAFLDAVQTTVKPADIQDWLPLPSPPPGVERPPTWEHASWITTEDVITGALRRAVDPEASVVDQAGWRDADRVRAVLARRGAFVALLESYPQGRFGRLIDRPALLERVAAATIDEASR